MTLYRNFKTSRKEIIFLKKLYAQLISSLVFSHPGKSEYHNHSLKL